VKLRFRADADLKHAIVAGTLRRAAAIDFRRAEAVPLENLSDPEVLSVCSEAGRVLVSHDVNTMAFHFREFVQRRESPGLILIPQTGMSIREAIDGLILLWEVVDSAELENRICHFPSLVIT
jgi:hypothetical protein